MEHIHGVDVSWMTHGPSKDRTTKLGHRRNTAPSQIHRDTLSPTSPPPSPAPAKVGGEPTTPTTPTTPTSPGRQNGSADKNVNGAGASPQRRPSWLSNISSKFSSSQAQSPPQASNVPPKQGEISVPKANPAKNAVLQHAAKYQGEGPYTPAPPGLGQAGLLRVFRRLSSSAGHMSPGVKGTHGLVERKVLNVDRNRERCPLKDLNQAKLRRVAFCVDVEIAPMPKYAEGDAATAPRSIGDNTQKKKLTEKGEGEALKHPKACEIQKEESEDAPKPPAETTASAAEIAKDAQGQADAKQQNGGGTADKAVESKKKDKKKKSEEERKARKEKKRKQAEANGSIPMEIHLDSDSSTASTPTTDITPHAQLVPTTNPVRIYRRCCQLRETPILKKITEQLTNPTNFAMEQGVVEKLDLTGYWLQLPDLVTLGDYLAVVPIKEVILENCGLTDEGLRVVLAGLLAVRKSDKKQRKPVTGRDTFVQPSGAIQRLVLKNNKIGPEGWRHLCLFIYMCRSLTYLDLSNVAFPHASSSVTTTTTSSGTEPLSAQLPAANGSPVAATATSTAARSPPLTVCQLLSRSIAERLAGPTLEFLNLGETGIRADELGVLMEGITACGIRRLGLALNDIDGDGVKHIAAYLRSGKCEGLDLAGNEHLRDQLDVIAEAITGDIPFWALSIAACDLEPTSLSKLFPRLTKLKNFHFIDLSHNRDLFRTDPSAISLLRRYLPKMACLKRIHLADVAMTSEQAIALAEILPEVEGLAHINLLQNSELTKLADARTEAAQEEACALFASLLAATRVSTSIVAVDIDVPTEQSGEIVRAMAKQVVAYCLRNMESFSLSKLVADSDVGVAPRAEPEYPDVIQHLVGHDVMMPDETDDIEAAPDDDYVIGGTGVVRALACCLKNRGDDSRRQSGEFARDTESGTATPKTKLPTGKAKDMSKHLLGSARKIRQRLQPALSKAKAASGQDTQAYRRLLFLDNTLDGIIKRFEDEFPDTRMPSDSATPPSPPSSRIEQVLSTSPGANEAEPEATGSLSDAEDGIGIRPSGLARSNSVISISSKGLTNEEGRVLRAGHKFRSGWLKLSNLLSGVEEIGADPNHSRVLYEMLEDLNNDELLAKVKEKGVVRVFQEDRDSVFECFRAQDPEHWDLFIESQKMARANVKVSDVNGANGANKPSAPPLAGERDAAQNGVDEEAVVD